MGDLIMDIDVEGDILLQNDAIEIIIRKEYFVGMIEKFCELEPRAIFTVTAEGDVGHG